MHNPVILFKKKTMYKNYFKIAWRQLFKNKLFSALNIFGLAASLAICLLVITILNDQYSYDNFHENGDRIFRSISAKGDNNSPILQADVATTPLTLPDDMANQYPFIKETVRLAKVGGDVLYQDKMIGSMGGLVTDAAFLDVFSFGWIRGDKTTALQEPGSIVLTEETADKFFPREEPIGKIIDYGGLGKFKITGIIPTPPIRSHIRFDYLMSYATVTAMTKEQQGEKLYIYDYDNIYRGLVYFLLDDKKNETKLSNALATISKEYSDRSDEFSFFFQTQELSDIMPSQDLGNELGIGTPKVVLYFLMTLGFIIMLAACFNYMNLSVARSLKRAKEIGIRKVAGAEKKDIIIQFLGESILISLLSFVVAIGLLEFLIPAVYSLDPFLQEAFYLTKSPKLYLIFLGFSIFIGFIAGIFPAFNISKFNPIQSIQKLSNVKIFSQIGFRKALVTFQFALSLIFILTVIIVLQQQKKVLETDLGVNIDNKFGVWMNDETTYDIFAQQVRQIKGVKSVSASDEAILGGGYNYTNVSFNEQEDSMIMAYSYVSPDYVNNMEIKFLVGKNFPNNINSKGEQFVIINEKATKTMGFQTPNEALGQSVWMDSVALSVIGVVKDFHYENIYWGQIKPYGIRLGNNLKLANIHLEDTNSAATIQAINSTWDKLSPNRSISSFYFDERIYHLSKFFKMGSSVIGFVGFLTILISCLGLLGMVIFTIEGRLKEVGIRKVLGASERNLNWQLAKGFFVLLGVAIAIAVPLTIFLSNLWLQNFLIRINVGFGIVLLGIGIILLLAMITIFSQTRSAVKTNPVNVLKND